MISGVVSRVITSTMRLYISITVSNADVMSVTFAMPVKSSARSIETIINPIAAMAQHYVEEMPVTRVVNRGSWHCRQVE